MSESWGLLISPNIIMPRENPCFLAKLFLKSLANFHPPHGACDIVSELEVIDTAKLCREPNFCSTWRSYFFLVLVVQYKLKNISICVRVLSCGQRRIWCNHVSGINFLETLSFNTFCSVLLCIDIAVNVKVLFGMAVACSWSIARTCSTLPFSIF